MWSGVGCGVVSLEKYCRGTVQALVGVYKVYCSPKPEIVDRLMVAV